jgi:hypothetical protein
MVWVHPPSFVAPLPDPTNAVSAGDDGRAIGWGVEFLNTAAASQPQRPTRVPLLCLNDWGSTSEFGRHLEADLASLNGWLSGALCR